MGVIIKQGKIWYENRWVVSDLLIEEGVIKEIAPHLADKSGNEIIEAGQKLVIPGLIDCHAHLREPGGEEKETIFSGARAALKGGFTTVLAMPNTNPVIDSPDLIDYIYKKGQNAGWARVLPIGAITVGEQGEKLADLEGMVAKGAVAFSDDGKGVQSAALMKETMERAARMGRPILAHCEDETLSGNGVIHQGAMANKLMVPGIPAEAEYLQVQRDLLLAEATGVHYHVCHLSSGHSVQLIREAKAKGVNVTAEVTPHHLLLTDLDLREPYSSYKINPPLRSEMDQIALIEGILDGTIDIIATDHAPHTVTEKKRGLLAAPFGAVGLETAFPLLFTHLVRTGIVTLERLIELMSTRPAEIFNLEGGVIQLNAKADLTIIDIDALQRVEPSDFYSKSTNTPFAGWELFGWPTLTMVAGEVKWRQGENNDESINC